MKKILFIMTAMLVLGSTGADAQGFLNKLKEKAKEKISKKIEGKVEEKAKEVVMQDAEEAEEAPAEEAKPVIPQAKGEAVKSDFVPGSVVIFEDNLQGEKMGEFPSKWDLIENNAEVAKMNGKMAIKFEHGSNTSITPLIKDGNKKYLPEVYTLEFDFFVSATEAHSAYILHQETEQDWVSEIFFNHDNINWRVIKPNGDQTDGNAPTESFIKQNSWNHFALSFNKRALKVYINNHRVMNIPNAKAPSWFYIRTEFWEEHVDYITNVRLAKGGVELYQQNAQTMTAIEKAITETGKFVTNNILFDTGKATLKQESMAEIQKVADYMKKNPKARFEVQGHTDNQGSDKVNDPLSQQRAEAIVAALVKMGCDEFNLKAVGKGSHEPVADNKTAEGRAKNRRVEFIKK